MRRSDRTDNYRYNYNYKSFDVNVPPVHVHVPEVNVNVPATTVRVPAVNVHVPAVNVDIPSYAYKYKVPVGYTNRLKRLNSLNARASCSAL